MATEVANNQNPVTSEENVEKKVVVETTETTTTTITTNVDKKDDGKADDADKTGENHNENQAAPAKAEPPAPKYTVHKTNFEKDVSYLYQFSRTPLLPSLSPYCLKVETWLRLAGLKYEVCEIIL